MTLALELFTQELDKITEKITKQELAEKEGSWKSSWWWYGSQWPDKKTCLERKAVWKALETNIKRKIELKVNWKCSK